MYVNRSWTNTQYPVAEGKGDSGVSHCTGQLLRSAATLLSCYEVIMPAVTWNFEDAEPGRNCKWCRSELRMIRFFLL